MKERPDERPRDQRPPGLYAAMLDRLVRIETRLVKLMVASGLDAEGNPAPKQQQRRTD